MCQNGIFYERADENALRALASCVSNAKFLVFGSWNTKNQPLWDVSNAPKKKKNLAFPRGQFYQWCGIVRNAKNI